VEEPEVIRGHLLLKTLRDISLDEVMGTA
jgi:hypothetical protein